MKEGVAALGINRTHPGRYDRVAGNGERQAVDDHATELLALHVYPLPKGRRTEQNRMWCEAELLEQNAFGRVTLQEHRKFELPQQTLIYVIHLGVTGEQDECSSAGDLQQPPDAIGSARGKLWRTRVG